MENDEEAMRNMMSKDDSYSKDLSINIDNDESDDDGDDKFEYVIKVANIEKMTYKRSINIDDDDDYDDDDFDGFDFNDVTAPMTSRNDSTKSIIKSKRDKDTFQLAEDAYGFIFVASVHSKLFMFSLYVVALKLLIFSIVASGIAFQEQEHDQDQDQIKVMVAKFFLIPVAIAMQDDLIYAIFLIANIKYDQSALDISESATNKKFILGIFLRTLDGIF
jgi:hypothetical protein